MGAGYADIIFFAAVAVYLGFKLFSVLGKKNEEDVNFENKVSQMRLAEMAEKPTPKLIPDIKNEPVKVVNDLSKYKFADESAKAGVNEIIVKDSSFSMEDFIEGAKGAFEMVLKAYSEGDKKTLKDLLADDVYANLESVIDQANRDNHVNIKSLIGVDDVEVLAAGMSASRAKITLKFLTEQIAFTKDANGNVISGDAKRIDTVEDVWEFERNIRSNNPNWTITAL